MSEKIGSTEINSLADILQAIIDQGNLTVTEVNSSVANGTNGLEIFKNIKLQELSGATSNHTITLNAQAQELVKYISEQGFRIRINQPNHGFLLTPINFEVGANRYVKASVSNPADAMAIKVDADNFDLVTSGSYPMPEGVKDSAGSNLVIDEYYFLDPNQEGKFTAIKPTTLYQPLFLVAKDKDVLRVLIEVDAPIDLKPRVLDAEADYILGLVQEANEMKDLLNSGIDIGSNVLEELVGETNEALSAKGATEVATANANKAKSELNQVISTSANSKGSLENSISAATSAQTALNGRISEANSANSTLNKTTSDANTKNVELKSSISTANSKITEMSSLASVKLSEINTLASSKKAEITSLGDLTKTQITSLGDYNRSQITILADDSKKAILNISASSKEDILTARSTSLVDIVRLSSEKLGEINTVSTQTISDINTTKTQAFTELDEKVVDKNIELDAKVVEVTQIVDAKVVEVVKIADAKIEELDSYELNTIANVNDGTRFRHWVGEQSEFDVIPYKEVETKYDMYVDGEYSSGRYWKNKEPTSYYNRNIVSVLDVNSRGLHNWNKNTPIKTLNNNGLQKFKETDDYIIYLDKDAVVEDGIPVQFEALFEVNKKTGIISTSDINLSIEIGANNIGQEFPELESKFESLILGKITIQTKKEVSMEATNIGQENPELGGTI